MTKKYTKEEVLRLIERAKPKEDKTGNVWVKEAQERYEKDRKFWGNEADRGELETAIQEARAIEGRNQALKEYYDNLLRELNNGADKDTIDFMRKYKKTFKRLAQN